MRNIFILLTILVALACQAEVITGKVVRVTDGDTITILDADKVQHKVRLAGIDAPEKAQAFGERSRDSLEDLVAGRSVTVETHKKDRYGRLVGKVLLNGLDVNMEQIRRGMAWFYRDYAHEQSKTDQRSLTELSQSQKPMAGGCGVIRRHSHRGNFVERVISVRYLWTSENRGYRLSLGRNFHHGGLPGGTRTPYPELRRFVLYPDELPAASQ